MLKNYPSTCLFLIFGGAFIVLLFCSSLIGMGNIYVDISLKIALFILKILSILFFIFASIEVIGSLHFRKHIH